MTATNGSELELEIPPPADPPADLEVRVANLERQIKALATGLAGLLTAQVAPALQAQILEGLTKGSA